MSLGWPKSPDGLAWPDARLPPETERALPRDSTGELVTRPFGAAAALVLAIIVSLFGTSLSVGRQPVPIEPIDQSAFTVIVPPAATGGAPVDAPPGIFTDFRNPATRLSRVTATMPLPRRQVVQKRSKVVRVQSQAVTTKVGNSRRVKGIATWFCLPGVSACTSGHRGGLYAAAGSELRIGNWRGRMVKVCGNGNCVVVKLIDWCACGGSRIIDLYHDAFSRLASPSSGGIGVTVTW
jgi:hypothetical protein